MDGRYGPYVKWEKVNATLPKDLDPQDVTLERAVELIAEKQAKGPCHFGHPVGLCGIPTIWDRERVRLSLCHSVRTWGLAHVE
jgi:hypothetical protein